ncbi:MAG: helical backbone metal receptor, partial [Thermoguttaceae bacterium]
FCLRLAACFFALTTPFFFLSAYRGHPASVSALVYSTIYFALAALAFSFFLGHKKGLRRTLLFSFIVCFSLRESISHTANLDSVEKSRCRRIVSMAPSLTESLYALGLGERLVGVTRYCDYPPEAKKLPRVGGFLDPNFEAILALKPDIVFLLVEHERSLPGFKKLGLETRVFCHKTIEGVVDSLRAIPSICGDEAHSGKIAEKIQSRLDHIRRLTAHTERPSVMVAIDRVHGAGGLMDVYIAGRDGYFEKMIELAGGKTFIIKPQRVIPSFRSKASCT